MLESINNDEYKYGNFSKAKVKVTASDKTMKLKNCTYL